VGAATIKLSMVASVGSSSDDAHARRGRRWQRAFAHPGHSVLLDVLRQVAALHELHGDAQVVLRQEHFLRDNLRAVSAEVIGMLSHIRATLRSTASASLSCELRKTAYERNPDERDAQRSKCGAATADGRKSATGQARANWLPHPQLHDVGVLPALAEVYQLPQEHLFAVRAPFHEPAPDTCALMLGKQHFGWVLAAIDLAGCSALGCVARRRALDGDHLPGLRVLSQLHEAGCSPVVSS